MVSVAENRNGNPKLAAYIRQIQTYLTYFTSRHLRAARDEEVEGWRHVLYQVQAEALENWRTGIEVENVEFLAMSRQSPVICERRIHPINWTF